MHPLIDADSVTNEVIVASGAEVLSDVVIKGQGNRLSLGDRNAVDAFVPAGLRRDLAEGPAIRIAGDDNRIEVADDVRMTLNIVVQGDGNRIHIGEGCRLNGFITIRCSGATLSIGAGTTVVNGSLQLHEPGEIRIGADCMIANQVYVSLSDVHPIRDRASGDRINPAASVEIGDHVWLGLRSMVMKGSRVGAGAVIAAGAVVSGDVPAHAVAAGVPARVVRRDVVWSRDFDPIDVSRDNG